jgi:small-conductance mechanosensitive channel
MNYQDLLKQFSFLNFRFHGIVVGSMCAAVLVAITVFVALRWIRRGVANRLKRIAAQTATTLDDLTMALVLRTNVLFMLSVAIYAGTLALPLGQRTAKNIALALLVVTLWQIGLWAHELIDYLIRQMTNRHAGADASLKTAAGALSFIARVAVWSLLILVVLSNLNVDITTLVAGLGVGGIAVALAVQNILGDLFASLSILLDKPFAVGHFIVVDGIAGTVDHVGLKSTRVRSLSGEEIVLSNTDLLKSRIHNYKRLLERRVLFGFGVTYDTGYDKLAAIPGMVREIIQGLEKTRFDRTHFKEYGDSSLNFEVVYLVLDPDYNIYMDIQQAVNLGIYRRFEQEKIDFAFPTRTLYVAQTELTEARAAGDGADGDGTDAPASGTTAG